jgi:hypothetical protein
MKSFRNDYKLYSLRILNIQIIPSYYDLKRFSISFKNRLKKENPIKLQKSGIQYQLNKFKALFNTEINYKPYKRNTFNKFIDSLLNPKKKNVLSD